jgi:hypothetical protein
MPTGSHYPIGTRIGRSRVTRVTLSKIRLSGGAFRPAEPSAPDGGGVAQAVLLMIADSCSTIQRKRSKARTSSGSSKMMPQRFALDPGDRPERFDPLDLNQNGSADPRGGSVVRKRQPVRDTFSSVQRAVRSGSTKPASNSIVSRATDRLPSFPNVLRMLILMRCLPHSCEHLVRRVEQLRSVGRNSLWNGRLKINGRWYRYQRPLRLILEVLGLKGHSFRFPASGSPAAPKDRRFA